MVAITSQMVRQRLEKCGKTAERKREIEVMLHFKKLNNNNPGRILRFQQGVKMGMKKWSGRCGYNNDTKCGPLCQCDLCKTKTYASKRSIKRALVAMKIRQREIEVHVSLSALPERTKQKALAKSMKKYNQEKLDLERSESLGVNEKFVKSIYETGLPGLTWQEYKMHCCLPTDFKLPK